MSEAMQEGAVAFADKITSDERGQRSASALSPEVRVTIALLLAAVLEARGELPELPERVT